MTDATSLDTEVPGLNEGGDPASDTPGAVPDEPSASKGWLKMISDAEKFYHEYHVKADNIDKQYANLERLAQTTRDREIQLFWANISVMAPSCYSRPPVPVVGPRFKTDAELPRTTSEILERSCIVMFEKENIDGVMRLIRDDLVILARGAAWLRLSTEKGTERVCIDHADRKDFLCEPARNWKECDWVSKRSWLTKEAAKKRFEKNSGKAYETLSYAVRKDAEADSDDGASKAGVWELWCKSQNIVVWVAEGSAVCLDEGPPHLTLEDFFPCPKPAFGTVQRRSLMPVPDMLFYKDQLEEINEITDRIAALTEAVRVRGFYSAGGGDVADAVEAAFKATTNNAMIVPIANLQGLSGVALKDAIAWLPIDVISATITAIVALRKELIQDVYEVTGLSDIMRGSTDANETLGAQQMKSQYGSVRIKDRQDELTRLALDITRLTAEIMAENFSGKTLMEMSQVTLPTDADIAEKAAPLKATLTKVTKEAPELETHLKGLSAEVQHAQQDPEVAQLAQQNPQQAQQVMSAVQQQVQEVQSRLQSLQQQGQQAQQQLQVLEKTITIDKVMKLLRAQKLRPFILDIETDSTITPDENLAKQRATEYVTAIGGFLKDALPLVQENPQAAPMVAGTLKFINSQFRAGRELQGVVDKFADQMEQKAQQPPPPNPEMVKQQAAAAEQSHQQQLATQKARADAASQAADDEQKKAQAAKDMAEAQAQEADTQRLAQEADTAARDADTKRKIDVQRELDASDARRQDLNDKAQMALLQRTTTHEKHQQDMEKGGLEIELLHGKIAQSAMAGMNEMAKADGSEGDSAPTSAGASAAPKARSAHPFVAMMRDVKTMHEAHQATHAKLDHLTKVMLAPNVIQRGADGRVTGSRKVIE